MHPSHFVPLPWVNTWLCTAGMLHAVSDWSPSYSAWETSAANNQWRVRQINTDAPARGNASKAVDGNTNTTYDNNVGSCTHTHGGPVNPWWVADLGATAPANSRLVSVRITNRQDCCWGEYPPVPTVVARPYTSPDCSNAWQFVACACRGLVTSGISGG
jgi:hypothetical protein